VDSAALFRLPGGITRAVLLEEMQDVDIAIARRPCFRTTCNPRGRYLSLQLRASCCRSRYRGPGNPGGRRRLRRLREAFSARLKHSVSRQPKPSIIINVTVINATSSRTNATGLSQCGARTLAWPTAKAGQWLGSLAGIYPLRCAAAKRAGEPAPGNPPPEIRALPQMLSPELSTWSEEHYSPPR